MHPFDLVGVHVRANHLHRGRQVDDHGVVRGGLHDVDDGIADLDGEVQLGSREGFRRVLPAPIGIRVILGNALDELCGIRGQLLDGRAVLAEYHAALQFRGGVVEVHDDVLRALARLEGAPNQVLAGLHQNLNGDVFGDLIALNNLADKVEVRLGGRGEAHFDLLVTHGYQQVEHAVLALRGHRINQGLVTIAQIHRTPLRGHSNLLIRPRAVRQRDGLDLLGEALVAVDRHRGAALLIPGGLVLVARAGRGGDFAGSGDERIVGGHGVCSLPCVWPEAFVSLRCCDEQRCSELWGRPAVVCVGITTLRDGALAVELQT